MTKWIDVSVFAAGVLLLVAGVGMKDVPAALIVLGCVMASIVVAARFAGAKK